jgi:glycosyltransferase involved in cell wall biosynthesis
MRIGLYTDMVFSRDADGLTSDKSFVRLVNALAARTDEIVLFGRLAPEPARAPYPVDEEIRFVALPHYRRVTQLHVVAATLPRSAGRFRRELRALDAVLVFGPHPVALAFALLARRAGVPLVLGVRHDYPEYIRGRLPGPGWGWGVPAARLFDRAFLRLARDASTVAVGPELAARYRRAGGRVLETGVSLVAAGDVVSEREALARDWSGELRCLSVGRLASEKNPLLLVDVIGELRARNPPWRLVVAGDGPLRSEVAGAARARGLGDALELLGEVPNGAPLWRLYRDCHAFLHVSLTEGMPQVLVEAHAAGAPVVATAVGGVAGALGGGERGLLVPPRDPTAAADALERLAADPALRRRLVSAGLAYAREHTLEAQVDQLTDFIRAALPGAARSPRPRPPARPAARNSARTRATGTAPRPGRPAARGTASPRG